MNEGIHMDLDTWIVPSICPQSSAPAESCPGPSAGRNSTSSTARIGMRGESNAYAPHAHAYTHSVMNMLSYYCTLHLCVGYWTRHVTSTAPDVVRSYLYLCSLVSAQLALP